MLRYHALTADLLQRSARKARELGHSYVGSAHILLSLSREPGAAGQVLRMLGVDPELTECMAQLLYGAGTPDLPLPQGLTRDARRLLYLAAAEAKGQKSREVFPHHLLLALARQETSAAAELLQLSGVSSDMLFTHTVDYLRWEQSVASKGKKEAVTTKLWNNSVKTWWPGHLPWTR